MGKCGQKKKTFAIDFHRMRYSIALSIRLLFRFGSAGRLNFEYVADLLPVPRGRNAFATDLRFPIPGIAVLFTRSAKLLTPSTPTRTSHGDKINIYKIFKHSAPDGNVAIMDCCESHRLPTAERECARCELDIVWCDESQIES